MAVQGIDVDSLWEQGNFMAKVDEGMNTHPSFES